MMAELSSLSVKAVANCLKPFNFMDIVKSDDEWFVIRCKLFFRILVRMLVRQVLWKSPVSLMVSQLRFVRNKKPVGTEVIKFPKQRYVEPPTVHLGNLNPLQKCADAEPISGVKNPYEKEKRRCLLCRYDIKLDYKNPRLLSQFVSAFTGRFYEKHITGLCEHQQKKLYETIKKSRMAGYMPVMTKDPRFLKDPRLFDPMNPQRPNPY